MCGRSCAAHKKVKPEVEIKPEVNKHQTGSRLQMNNNEVEGFINRATPKTENHRGRNRGG